MKRDEERRGIIYVYLSLRNFACVERPLPALLNLVVASLSDPGMLILFPWGSLLLGKTTEDARGRSGSLASSS